MFLLFDFSWDQSEPLRSKGLLTTSFCCGAVWMECLSSIKCVPVVIEVYLCDFCFAFSRLCVGIKVREWAHDLFLDFRLKLFSEGIFLSFREEVCQVKLSFLLTLTY